MASYQQEILSAGGRRRSELPVVNCHLCCDFGIAVDALALMQLPTSTALANVSYDALPAIVEALDICPIPFTTIEATEYFNLVNLMGFACFQIGQPHICLHSGAVLSATLLNPGSAPTPAWASSM